MLIDKSRLYDDTYPLNNELKIRNPSVQNVLDFGEPDYQALIHLFLVHPVDIIVEIFMMCDEDYDRFFEFFDSCTQYDIFIMFYRMDTDRYNKLMQFFFDEEEEIAFAVAERNDTKEIVLYDEKRNAVFDLTSFMIMSHFIKTIHNIPEDPHKTAKKSNSLKKAMVETGIANKPYLDQQREKDRLAGKFDGHLNKTMTKISIASQYRRDELMRMKLYEFYEIFHQVVEYTYWSFRMTGAYSGMVDTSKIPKKDLEWFNK